MEDVEMKDDDDDIMEGDPPIESLVLNISTFFFFRGAFLLTDKFAVKQGFPPMYTHPSKSSCQWRYVWPG